VEFAIMSAINTQKLIPDPQVAKDLGRSLRTLARWDEDPKLNFPKPIPIKGRKYRDADELASWLRERAMASVSPAAPSADPTAKFAPKR
jgi:predicted DNA-binding transcriptional regulator AlpA